MKFRVVRVSIGVFFEIVLKVKFRNQISQCRFCCQTLLRLFNLRIVDVSLNKIELLTITMSGSEGAETNPTEPVKFKKVFKKPLRKRRGSDEEDNAEVETDVLYVVHWI